MVLRLIITIDVGVEFTLAGGRMTVQISRKDITSEELLDLQSETRFLKLPVAPYLDLLGITPLSSQVAIINAINNPKYRFICAALSRRQGKTYIANIIGQLVLSLIHI